MVSKTSLLLPLSLSCLVSSFVIQTEVVASEQENHPSAVAVRTEQGMPQKIIEEDSEPEATTKTSASAEKKVQFATLPQNDEGEDNLSQTLTQRTRLTSRRGAGAQNHQDSGSSSSE